MTSLDTKGAEDAARRVSACLAACKNISTKALEAGDLNVLQLQLDRLVLTQQRDRLVAVLEGLFEIGDVFTSAIEAKDIHASDFEVWEEKARAAIAIAKAQGAHQWKTGGPGEGASNHLVTAEAWSKLPTSGPSIAEMQAAGQLPIAELGAHYAIQAVAKTFTDRANEFYGQIATEHNLHRIRSLISEIELGAKVEGRGSNADEAQALALLRGYESQLVFMKGGAQ